MLWVTPETKDSTTRGIGLREVTGSELTLLTESPGSGMGASSPWPSSAGKRERSWDVLPTSVPKQPWLDPQGWYADQSQSELDPLRRRKTNNEGVPAVGRRERAHRHK